MENNDFKANQKQYLIISIFFFTINIIIAFILYNKPLTDKNIFESVGEFLIYTGLIFYTFSIIFYSRQIKKGTKKKYIDYIRKVVKFQNETIVIIDFILHILQIVSILSLITHLIITIPSTNIIWLNTMVDAFNSTSYQLIAFSIITLLKVCISDTCIKNIENEF